jgi:hypothetical protein
MAQKLNRINGHAVTPRRDSASHETLKQVQGDVRSNLFLKIGCGLMFSLLCSFTAFSQEEPEGIKSPKYKDYNNDSTFNYFARYRDDVAKAQINALKNGGALLVRLKTNYATISKLKTAGKADLATQIERETAMNNKLIVRAYTNVFKFCPVYFFYSTVSDSVKHKQLSGIFLDTNLNVNPSIVCNASFYLVAEMGTLYSSSIGLLTEPEAAKATEQGTGFKDFAIVVKNRYFIQLHEPFPYFQKGYKLKVYGQYVKKFNDRLQAFYSKNAGYTPNETIKAFVY